ncbi:hypothetical protein B0T20DRAFT_389810 [Sordaria brevicollis]|uniref:Uncharacterized protein n=1 Tax=Sordaria brevicollis TaxID=83679 RepID=A0AAE0PLQ7_SORBR|nr:hypothetical protein B0T20DRAFT_389810 [Sordaria brevicollis]
MSSSSTASSPLPHLRFILPITILTEIPSRSSSRTSSTPATLEDPHFAVARLSLAVAQRVDDYDADEDDDIHQLVERLQAEKNHLRWTGRGDGGEVSSSTNDIFLVPVSILLPIRQAGPFVGTYQHPPSAAPGFLYAP